MKKGKTLPLSLIKKICAAILIKHSYSQITKLYQVGKSTIQRCKQCLEKAKISALNDFFRLEEEQLAKIIYGDKAVLKRRANSTTIILKKPKNFAFKGNYLMPNDSYFEKVIDTYGCKSKKELYLSYVNEALSNNRLHVKRTTFYLRLNDYLKRHNQTTRYFSLKKHAYGDEVQLDWCGEKVTLLKEDGTPHCYQIFVMTWAYSYYCYACFVPNQTTKTTIEAINAGFRFFKCLPNQLGIDNCKALVTRHEIGHEAIINQNFEYYTDRANLVVNVNNPFSPNEKSAVEHTVHLIQQRVLTSIPINTPVKEAQLLLENLISERINCAKFRGDSQKTRQYFFIKHEFVSARALPTALPNYVEHYKNLKVLKNSHVNILGNYYSVPYEFIDAYVNVDIEDGQIKIIYQRQVIATHHMILGKGTYISDKTHFESRNLKLNLLSKLETTSDLIEYAKSFSFEIQSFCATLSLFRKSFQIAKVATLYLIKLHQKLKLQNKDHLLNVAITKVMQKYHHDEITTHHIDEELKILQTFQEVS